MLRRPRRAWLLALLALAPVRAALPQGVEVSGRVVAFRSQLPLAGVEVAIPALAILSQTDSTGAFALANVPRGVHRVVARRLGYQAFETDLEVGATAPPPLRIVMLPLQRLDSVEVIATPLDPAMLEFEEHRRMGLGSYLTREHLVRYEGMRMSSVMPQLSAVSLVRSGQTALLTSRRHTVTPRRDDCDARRGSAPGSPIYTPSLYEANRGVACTCYAQVYLDGVLQNPGKPTEPFDVNSIRVDQIEAVEWYAGPSQTPAKYASLNSSCGVLVIHTRRSMPERPPDDRSGSYGAGGGLKRSGGIGS